MMILPASRPTTMILPRSSHDLEADGTAVIDDGALCVFVDGFSAPMIVRKRDGGYGYSATDLAAIRRRVREFHADRLIYVVDARQSDHFEQVFAVARKAGFLPDDVITEHVAFGTVLGTDGKPFKTREGTAVTLNYAARRRRGAGRAADRAGGDQVRRPVQRAEQGLRVRRRPDGADHRQHRPVPAVRARPDGPGAAQGARPRASASSRRCWCWTSRPSRRSRCCSPGSVRSSTRWRPRCSRTGCARTSMTCLVRWPSSTSSARCCKSEGAVRDPGWPCAWRRSGCWPPGSTMLGIEALERM